jgi:regulator of sigma E protease
LNLAILNLLPIPVLDGGHILFASIEGITKKPVKSKTMEKLILPFLILLVVLFIYLTYQDIVKLLHRLF